VTTRDGSTAYVQAGACIDAAREAYERSLQSYLGDHNVADLYNAALHYRRWQDLLRLKDTVAYYERYHVFPHEPGAP